MRAFGIIGVGKSYAWNDGGKRVYEPGCCDRGATRGLLSIIFPARIASEVACIAGELVKGWFRLIGVVDGMAIALLKEVGGYHDCSCCVDLSF